MRSDLLSTPQPRELTAEEYLHAKLDYEVTPHGLMSEMENAPEKIVVLDVRDAAAFAKSHIPGAQNIPEKELRAKGSSLPKGKRIITYSWDADCALAPTAALALAHQGRSVQFLAGGFAEWIRRELPVEKRVETRKH